jgi:hypothetical protein
MLRLRPAVLWGLLLLLLLVPERLVAQTELINGNVVVVGSVNLCVVTVGSTDAYACNLGRTITAYQPWTRYAFIPNVANTGPATVAFNGLAAVTIKKLVAGVKTDLVTGDIAINQPVEVYYDGTDMVWLGGAGGAAPGGSATQVQYNVNPTTLGGTAGLTADANCRLYQRGRDGHPYAASRRHHPAAPLEHHQGRCGRRAVCRGWQWG